jgi:D-glycero-alpha-D-manno-heptose-7-phosphate kinase
MVIRARAPLRIGLAGGGTDVSPYCDVYGGGILNATIDYYAYATLQEVPAGFVEIVSSDQDAIVRHRADDKLPCDGQLDLLKSVHNYVVREWNGNTPLSIRLSTHVDVPMGSGLGASSTLVVAVLKAYGEWLGIGLDDYELASTAFYVERIEAGFNGGRQDQYAAAFGGFNFMEFGASGHVLVNPLRIKDWVVSELESSMILFFTGKSRASASIIDEQKRNVENRNASAIEAMHQLKADAIRMKECLLRGRLSDLHRVFQTSWEAKKNTAHNVSNERIEALYRTALEAGAYCAKISGAGGGGFVLFLVDPMRRRNVITAIRSLYHEGMVFTAHFTSSGAQAWRLQC